MKKGTIVIKTARGGQVYSPSVEGLVDDCGLGIHKALNGSGYEVVHLQSGYAVLFVEKQKDARRAIVALEPIADWKNLTPSWELTRKIREVKGELGL